MNEVLYIIISLCLYIIIFLCSFIITYLVISIIKHRYDDRCRNTKTVVYADFWKEVNKR